MPWHSSLLSCFVSLLFFYSLIMLFCCAFSDRPHLRPVPFAGGSQREYPCEICGKVFHSEFSIKQHSTKHKEPSFMCTECQRSFIWKSSYDRHMKKLHNIDTKSIHCCSYERRIQNQHQHDMVNSPVVHESAFEPMTKMETKE